MERCRLLVISQIESQDVGVGYHQVALLQRIVAQGTGRGQNTRHSPHALVGNEAARLVYPLALPHLLWLVVERQGDRIAPRVTHDTARVAHVGHHQSRAFRYRNDRCRARKGCLWDGSR